MTRIPAQAWRCTPVIPALEMLRQGDCHELQNSQGHTARSISITTTTRKSQGQWPKSGIPALGKLEAGRTRVQGHLQLHRASLSLKIPVAAGTHSGFCREFCIPLPPFFLIQYMMGTLRVRKQLLLHLLHRGKWNTRRTKGHQEQRTAARPPPPRGGKVWGTCPGLAGRA